MRMCLRAHLNVDAASAAIRDGSLGRTVERLATLIRPEALYFMVDGGRRTILAVFDMDSPAMMPEIAEPLFQELSAEVTVVPAMVAAELQAGLAAGQPG